jgi:hypothetical protein
MSKPFKKPEGWDPGAFFERTSDQVFDDAGVTIGFVRLNRTGTLTLNWSTVFFNNPALPVPDEVRAEIVRVLRQHADGLESRELDKLMQGFGAMVNEQGGKA